MQWWRVCLPLTSPCSSSSWRCPALLPIGEHLAREAFPANALCTTFSRSPLAPALTPWVPCVASALPVSAAPSPGADELSKFIFFNRVRKSLRLAGVGCAIGTAAAAKVRWVREGAVRRVAHALWYDAWGAHAPAVGSPAPGC